MKNLFIITLLLVGQNSFATLSGQLNLNCRLQYIEPTNYKATITGPNKGGQYTLVFIEGYYGVEFEDKYLLKKESTLKLSSSKASVYEINIINGEKLIEVKTDKAGPVRLLCKS